MNEPTNGRIGIPGTGAPTGTPGTGGAHSSAPQIGVPGAPLGAETDRLLQAVEDDLDSLDQLETADQVAVFDRAHSALTEALARTADTGAALNAGPIPGSLPGRPGA